MAELCEDKRNANRAHVAVLAVSLTAACAKNADESGVVLTDAEMTTTQRDQVTTVNTDDFANVDSQQLNDGPTAGSVQDFIINVSISNYSIFENSS